MTTTALDPTTTYLHLGTGPEVTQLPVTDDFWSTLDERTELHQGRLVTSFRQEESWPQWEMHPTGDELIVALDGRFTFHLDNGVETTSVRLAPGQLLVMPKGTWHTADVDDPGQMLVVTWGEGTSHRPRDT